MSELVKIFIESKSLNEGFFKNKKSWDETYEKEHKFTSKAESIIFNQTISPKQSQKINEHSLLANPGLYLFIGAKGNLIKIISNKPYDSDLVIWDPFNQEKNRHGIAMIKFLDQEWGIDLLNDSNYKCATKQESIKATDDHGAKIPYAWSYPTGHDKGSNWYRIPLSGESNVENDAAVISFEEAFGMNPEAIKNNRQTNIWQYPSVYNKVKDVLNSLLDLTNWREDYLVHKPTFVTANENENNVEQIEYDFEPKKIAIESRFDELENEDYQRIAESVFK